jgi:phosphoglycolate phosphatase-like HAD superfamily hydrolase
VTTPAPTPRPRRPRRTTLAVASLVLGLVAGAGGTSIALSGADRVAPAAGDRVPPPPAQPTRANQIQNVDRVKTAIEAYYGDRETKRRDPVDGTERLHTFDPRGAYARQTRRLAGRIDDVVRRKARPGAGERRPAIVLDVDDTSLVTYNYEIWADYSYDPETNGAFVEAGVFPAVPGMVALVDAARERGVKVFWLTGRPGTQERATIDNLREQGFTGVWRSSVFTEDYQRSPWLKGCAPECETVQYKSRTRRHIEKLGYRVVATVGDQYSDLEGGTTGRAFKVPNPMYYLP